MTVALAWAKRAGCWLVDHWYVPAVALAAVLVFFLGAFRGPPPRKRIRKELDAIDAGRRAADAAIELGVETTVEHLQKFHEEAIRDLDEKQTAKVERLRRDPRALARYLERVGAD